MSAPATDRPLRGYSLGHVPALDGVRAVAAIAVVGFHAHIPGFANGDIGVDIFFALSGFLITSILVSRSGPGSPLDFRDFYRRRALRLLPAYFAVVLVCVLVESVLHYGGTFKGAVASAAYAANWAVVADAGLGSLGHTWSLSIEEQFYLVWPALLALLLHRMRWDGAKVLRAVTALTLVSWGLVVALAVADVPARVAANATPTRAAELLIGAILAVFVATPALAKALGPCRPWSGVSIAGLGAAALLVALIPLSGLSDAVNAIVGWPVIAVLTCVAVYASLRAAAPLTTLLSGRFMVGVGKRSYGLYLWHFPVFVIIDTRWGLDSWGARLGGLAITTVLVMLSYRYIELPFLARKDRRRAPATAAEPAPRLAAAPAEA